jgi:heme exporter protein C
MEGNILFSMLIMTFGLWMYSFAAVFSRVRTTILAREAETSWAREILEKQQ